mmetsp:Transcript_26100/g.60227  ORF Transcript_26100/g.60227 Transcript_26100/m.60227 type:complete len:268 (-) Transcript_26100:284-1087(-)
MSKRTQRALLVLLFASLTVVVVGEEPKAANKDAPPKADLNKDPYEVLGVAKNADLKEIKSAYKKLAVIHHPDKGGEIEKFKEIAAAFELLKDPERRASYDRFGHNGPEGQHGDFGGFGFGDEGFDPFSTFQHFFAHAEGGPQFFFQSGDDGGGHFFQEDDGGGHFFHHGGGPQFFQGGDGSAHFVQMFDDGDGQMMYFNEDEDGYDDGQSFFGGPMHMMDGGWDEGHGNDDGWGFHGDGPMAHQEQQHCVSHKVCTNGGCHIEQHCQ